MSLKQLEQIKKDIMNDKQNLSYTKEGFFPVYQVHPNNLILIIGQAPGQAAQNSHITWNDKSGDNLREWLGIDREIFYNSHLIGLMPMDFYFPGKAKSGGDLPPRKGFAEKWHPEILKHLPNVKLILVVGNYAAQYYLKENYKKNLTETVRNYKAYLPTYMPLVHPSPLNFRWHNNNPWFKKEVLPKLKEMVLQIIT